MTIKEVEARTGLARANIRYYEDQGFFHRRPGRKRLSELHRGGR